MKRVKEDVSGFSLDVLWLSELREVGSGEADNYFLGDDDFRSLCVRLNERINGWALVLGDGSEEDLSQLLELLFERRFSIYVAGAATKHKDLLSNEISNLGNKETSSIYFAKLLVRYSLIYGRVLPGDHHEISHIIEEFAPSVVFVIGNLTSLEHIKVQGILSLGAPVMVLGDNLGLVGNVRTSESIRELVESAWELRNIRARRVEKFSSDVPVLVGRRFTSEKRAQNFILVFLAPP